MKISDHSISFRSSHRETSRYERQEQLEVWVGDNPNRNAPSSNDSPSTDELRARLVPDRVEITGEPSETEKAEASGSKDADTPGTKEELELKILMSSIQMFLEEGRLKFRDPNSGDVREAYEEGNERIEDIRHGEATPPDPGAASEETESREPNWGVRYDVSERYEESEEVSFEAKGKIKTADGKTIDFSTSFNMKREFVMENEMSLRAGNAEPIDPLVINYDGKAAELGDENFDFDLTMDGTMESLKTLETGSGFLALDKNENGKIDDGSELFGPSTGNGFTELAQYDSDGNRFIDEGDDVYDDLYVMRPAEDGQQTHSLEDVGAGAIFLGSSDTPFSYKDGLQSEGELRRSGVYVREDGGTGFVQQIDLTPQSSNEDGEPNGQRSNVDVSA